MDRMGASGALVKMEGFPSGGNSTLVYFSCADCAIEEARVVEFGGSIQRGKFQLVSMAVFPWFSIPRETCLAALNEIGSATYPSHP
jgi:predicted enzyme related to lactoylglutathione lyase